MRLAALATAVILVACGSGNGGSGRDTLTQRQRDSILGASSLPGARAVQQSLRAADTAAARNRLLDSLRHD